MMPRSQVAFDKLTVDSAHQQASAAAAASTAANQKASFGDQMAKATLYAFDQKAQFEGQMAEAKLAAGDMQSAFDKLTCDNTDQKASVQAHSPSLPSESLHIQLYTIDHRHPPHPISILPPFIRLLLTS